MGEKVSQRNKPLMSLDLGSTTGFKLGDENVAASGTVELKGSRYEGGGMRYLRFERWLTEQHKLVGGIGEVVFEEVRRHLSTDSAHVYGGLLATLTAWCERNGVPYTGVPVGTIKKYITGKGNASKEQVIAAVRALGYSPADDNEADAIALFHYRLTERGMLS